MKRHYSNFNDTNFTPNGIPKNVDQEKVVDNLDTTGVSKADNYKNYSPTSSSSINTSSAPNESISILDAINESTKKIPTLIGQQNATASPTPTKSKFSLEVIGIVVGAILAVSIILKMI